MSPGPAGSRSCRSAASPSEGHEGDGLLEGERLARRRGWQRRHGVNRLQDPLFDVFRGRPEHIDPGELAVGRDLDMDPRHALPNAFDRRPHHAAYLLTPVVAVALAVLERVGGGERPFLRRGRGRRGHRDRLFPGGRREIRKGGLFFRLWFSGGALSGGMHQIFWGRRRDFEAYLQILGCWCTVWDSGRHPQCHQTCVKPQRQREGQGQVDPGCGHGIVIRGVGRAILACQGQGSHW